MSNFLGSLQVCPLFCRLSSIFYRTPIYGNIDDCLGIVRCRIHVVLFWTFASSWYTDYNVISTKMNGTKIVICLKGQIFWILQSKTSSKTWARFNKSLRLFNSLFLAILSFWQLRWAKRRLFASQKIEDNASKWGHLYRPCTSVALSNCVTGSVNNSRQTH